jgi:hypothetical protein
MYHALQKDTLCGKQRETLTEIEAHLVAKDALCTRSRAVVTHYALAAYFIQQIKILSHLF